MHQLGRYKKEDSSSLCCSVEPWCIHTLSAAQFLSLYLQKDVVALERVQRTAAVKTKQRLKGPGLLSMESGREDTIESYVINKAVDKLKNYHSPNPATQ